MLVIKTDHIGDFLLSLPAFSILRQGFPDARITFLCGAWIRDFAVESGLFDRVVCANIFSEVASEPQPPFDPKVLASYDFPMFDVAIDLRVEPESRFLLNHISARLKAGFECSESELDFAFLAPSASFNGKANWARHTRLLVSNFAEAIVSLFCGEGAAREALKPYIERGAVCLPRAGKGPLIGLNTRSGMPTKDWPLQNFASIIQQLVARHNATIVLLGSKRQQPDGDTIACETVGDRNNVVNLIGSLPLSDLPGVIDQLDLYVGPDTGTTHLAALLGRKTLCLHAGVVPLEAMGPLGPGVVILKRLGLPCSPCYLNKLSQCANGHRCMKSITPEQVVLEIDRMLAEDGELIILTLRRHV